MKDYIEYITEKFHMKTNFKYEAVQYLLEQKFRIWSNKNIYLSYDTDFVSISLESFIEHMKIDTVKNLHYNGIDLIFNDQYIINIRKNNISDKKLFYMLYILYERYKMKLSKKELKEFIKKYKKRRKT